MSTMAPIKGSLISKWLIAENEVLLPIIYLFFNMLQVLYILN